MSDKDLIQEAREWGGSYASWGDNGLVDRLADALEARQVDEARIRTLIDRAILYASENAGLSNDERWEIHDDATRAVVEFLGERHEPGLNNGKCSGCRDLGPHRNVPGCDYYEPEPDAPQPSESDTNKYAGFLARQNHQRDPWRGIGVKCLCGKVFDLDVDHAMHQTVEILNAARAAEYRKEQGSD